MLLHYLSAHKNSGMHSVFCNVRKFFGFIIKACIMHVLYSVTYLKFYYYTGSLDG